MTLEEARRLLNALRESDWRILREVDKRAELDAINEALRLTGDLPSANDVCEH